MIYTDEELRRWWQGLSKQAQLETLQLMLDRMENSDFALSLIEQYRGGRALSPKQLAIVRKWYRD